MRKGEESEGWSTLEEGGGEREGEEERLGMYHLLLKIGGVSLIQSSSQSCDFTAKTRIFSKCGGKVSVQLSL